MSKEKFIYFNLKPPTKNFTGRKTELLSISNGFSIEEKHLLKNIVVLSGLGGMGKTEIARKYSKDECMGKSDIAWIPAERIDRCTDSLIELARNEYMIDTKNMNFRKIFKKVYEYIVFSERKAMFILDNAGEYRKEFLPMYVSIHPSYADRYPKIFFTTRKAEFISNTVEVALQTMTKEDAGALVRKLAEERIIIIDEEVDELCAALQNFPLAINQAVSYMNSRSKEIENYTIKLYLEEFKRKSDELLAAFPESENDYQFSTKVTWNVTLEKLKNELNGEQALKIIKICSYLSPNEIDVPMIRLLAKQNNAEEEIAEEAAHLPFDYSMYNLEDGNIDIHRLVQQVIRNENENDGQEYGILSSILDKLYALTKTDKTVQRIYHLISAWEHAEKFNDLMLNFKDLPYFAAGILEDNLRYNEAHTFSEKAMKKLREILDEDDIELNNICLVNADLKRKLGNYQDSEELFKVLLGKLEKSPKASQMEILAIKSRIGDIHLEKGEYTQAEKLFEENFEKGKVLVGLRDERILSQLNNLGNTYKLQGRFRESRAVFHQYFENSEHLSKKSLMDAKINFAVVEKELGNVDEALKLYHENLELAKTEFPENHPKVITTVSNIALVHLHNGDYDNALLSFEKCYQMWKKLLGNEHPRTLSAKHSSGEVYLSMGDYDKAAEIFTEVYDSRKKIYVEKHRSIYVSLASLASIEAKNGNYRKAYTMYQEVVKKLSESLGKHHPTTLKYKGSAAHVLIQLGKYPQALKIYKSLVEVQSNQLGTAHNDVLSSKKGLAEVYLQMENFKETEKLFKEVLHYRTKYFGEKNIETIKIMNRLAEVYRQTGNTEAKNLWEKIIAAIQELPPKYREHEEMLNAHAHLAAYYTSVNRDAEALQLFKDVLKLHRSKCAPGHPNIIAAKNNIGAVYLKTGEYNKAVRVLLDIEKDFISTYGAHHDHTLKLQCNLAQAYKYLKEYPKALEMYKKVYDLQVKVKGESSIDSLTTKYNLAMLYHVMSDDQQDEVQRMIREVYRGFVALLGADHPMTKQISRNMK